MSLLFEIAVPGEPFVALEHLNISSTTWSPKHAAFWFECLGAISDPRASKVLKMVPGAKSLQWINLGLQQFHVPIGEKDTPDQVVRGSIGLDYTREELPKLRRRLQAAGVNVIVDYCKESLHPLLRFKGPNGNAFIVHGINNPALLGPLTSMCSKSSPCLPGGRSSGLGIRFIDFNLPHGTADIVAEFYEKIFHATIERPSPTSVQIHIGQCQSLRFHEIGSSEVLQNYDGHHIALYTNRFPEIYGRAYRLGAIYENPRFPHLTYGSLDNALSHNEFRVRDVVDPRTGQVVFSLEHEVRSLNHQGFGCTLRAVVSQKPGSVVHRPAVLAV